VASLLDQTDIAILASLQKDASASVAEIAEKVGLSQSPCWRRIQRLEQEGYVRDRVARLDRRKLGFNLEIFAWLRFQRDNPESLAKFEAAICAVPEVVECHMLMGDMDFLLRIVTRDVESYELLLRNQLAILPGVREIKSTISLSAVKDGFALPLAV
jgi:Lrp/AsnC family transcriptional regulator